MKKLLPILLAIVGLGAGGAAGFALRPPPEPLAASEKPTGKDKEAKEPEIGPEDRTFVKINNQFVVPVVQGDTVTSLVVLSVSLEANEGDTELLYTHEPKFRDAFIGILFDYAYAGGFGADFTSSPNLDRLRVALREAAQSILPEKVLDVLITDIVRQDT